MNELYEKITDVTWVAFDTETTGQYPLESEFCEIAAVKWKNGEIIDEFHSLIQPSKPMSEEVIKIHNITNEMVDGAPSFQQVVPDFYNFMKGCYVLAHHAPFDMGFMAIELEKLSLKLPEKLGFCTSLLSRKLIPESPNHRLQTLVKFLKLDGGQAHRALDDAKACLQLAIKCFERLGKQQDLPQLLLAQEHALPWSAFSLKPLNESAVFRTLLEAIKEDLDVQIVYQGGSRPGQARTVKPVSIVRQPPNNDFLVAFDERADKSKRYYLRRITQSVL